jgi:hypothetical protein
VRERHHPGQHQRGVPAQSVFTRLLACTKSKGRLRAPCCCPGDRPLGRFRLLLFLLRILARAREAVHARAMA